MRIQIPKIFFAIACITAGLSLGNTPSIAAVSSTTVAMAKASTADIATDSTLKHTTVNLNVRRGPGTDTEIIRTLPKGMPVSVVSETNGWSLLSNGHYVFSRYLKNVPEWESVNVDDHEYATRTRTTEPKSIKILNYKKAASLNKQQKITKYMISNDSTYYTVDESAAEGAVVAELTVGDVISIDGNLIRIDGEKRANYKTDTDAIKIWEDIGFKTCIQTCVPPYGGAIVIKYGHVIVLKN